MTDYAYLCSIACFHIFLYFFTPLCIKKRITLLKRKIVRVPIAEKKHTPVCVFGSVNMNWKTASMFAIFRAVLFSKFNQNDSC